MMAPPLTHHDILALVAPFTRSGRLVDLAACDRIQRRVVFKVRDRVADAPDLPGLRELLELEKIGQNSYRLTRTLVLDTGLKARLTASGAEPAQLLQRIDAVAAGQHFQLGAGGAITRHYNLCSDAQRPVLSSAEVQVDGLTLTMTVSPVRSVSADVLLTAPPGQVLEIPQDLLAVLGWAWSPLSSTLEGWSGKFRLRGAPDQRTRRAENALTQAARHLAHTLAVAPAVFHERQVAARWRVFFRRAIPVLTPLSILFTLLVMPRLALDDIPGLWMLVYQLPTVLIAISFMTQDQPRFEIPPWPRRASATSWIKPRIPVAAPKTD